ncbi:DUF421 domain-containing protein [Mucilaginibacter sp.]|uniref:DUF421 domain-containing protein n=1 Tax=Mucilaginibacter sp. TaxID=1882438 RepID=UPI0026204165|nr:YetF domain-containing protein [Mucilaginibacter sp.]MDB4924262.1 hypothetical protein [Mucilaginibacter sp.]
MEELIIKIFGEGKELNVYQMSARAFVIYIIALVLIRISGRRTFGKKSAFDNTIAIILGAILSRAVVGASDFVPTVVCCLVLVLLHRLLAMISLHNESFARLLRGESMVLFENEKLNDENMKLGLISKNDLMGDVRSKANINSLTNVKQVYLETSGEISVVEKEKPHK